MEEKSKNDFFKRKKTVVPEAGDYDHKNENDLLSCGLKDADSFKSRFESCLTSIEIKDGLNPLSVIVERMEDSLSKRELAFLLSKDIIRASLEEAGIEVNKQGKKHK